MSLLSLLTRLNSDMKRNRNGQAEPLTKQTFKRVFFAIEDHKYRLIFAIAWYTAERPGAILKLKVDDVYHAGTPRAAIVFPKSTRKDRKTRECPVSPKLRPLLAEYDPPLAGYLFPSIRDPAKPLPLNTYATYLGRVFDRLGMVGYSSYSTRRGAITELSRAGLSAQNIRAISGHSDLKSLQRYIDIDPEVIRAGVGLL